jgi:monoamine oxidase
MRIHRRDLLKLGAWAASTGLISAAAARAAEGRREPAALTPGKQQKVLVIGAGIAGLVAAFELRKLGHDVTILEAQRRPGGRVYTLREPFSDGLYVEVGAARIPDNHDLTLRYVREFDLPLTPFFPTGSRLYSIGGKRIRTDSGGEWIAGEAPLDLKPLEKKLGQWALLEKYVGGALAELGDPYRIDYASTAAKRFDSVTTAEYLRQQGASEAANNLMSWPWSTATDDRYSFLWALREIAYESQEKTRSKIVGGNDKLPRAFAATMKDVIHYGSPVVRIEQDEARVRAVVSRAGATEVFEADRLLCTVPFPALRDVQIAPALSPAKRRVIHELAYDQIVRATFQSRTRYWEKDGFNGFGHSDTPQQIWHFTHDQPGPRGLLVSFLCGGTGERVGDMEPEARERYLVAEMERAHPGLEANYEGMFVHVWHKHPWAKGGLALPSPGQMTGLCIGAEKPEGRIHFAGEHLSHFSGWIQGALESGLRAVREING